MNLLKKLSLIFIKIIPFVLGFIFLSQMILSYFLVPNYILDTITISGQIITIIGILILSKTFKFCIYHRILLYWIILCLIFYIITFYVDMDILWIVTIFSILLYIMLITILIIYIYLRRTRWK